ncbi:MAG: hypothetical protein EBY86_08450 [Acidimicrobiia bacterium]|nr:hypothetical protein [Acidimicrobiia bacterium]
MNTTPGTPMLLVFLAHWCPHCQAEVPVLVKWNQSMLVPDNLDVIAVATGTDETAPNYPPSVCQAWCSPHCRGSRTLSKLAPSCRSRHRFRQ